MSETPPPQNAPLPLPPQGGEGEIALAHGRVDRMFLGLVGMVACCAILLYIGSVERVWLDAAPWSYGMARADREPPPEGARPALIRKAPVDEAAASVYRNAFILPEATAEEKATAEEYLKVLGVDLAESILVFPASDDELAPLLESGRLPQRGAPELLRGDLAREDRITLDGVEFRVVGRIKPSVGGMAFAYYLPHSPEIVAAHFADARVTQNGWYIPDARELPEHPGNALEAFKEEEEQDEAAGISADDPYRDQPVAQVRTRTAYRYGSILALMLGAVGGYLLHAHGLRVLARQSWPVLGALFHEVAARPRLYLGLHVLLYGGFFTAMLAGGDAPLRNIAITNYVADEFTTGGLAYIGEAYAKGDILAATLATFRNNYVIQTVLLTFGISLFPPLALGLFKTLASFVLVGFVMVPLWAGAAGGYSYHSITMVLELEAYILACFVVVAWALRIFRTMGDLASGRSMAYPFAQSLQLYWGGIVATGGMLLIAAAYEAVTLILIGGR